MNNSTSQPIRRRLRPLELSVLKGLRAHSLTSHHFVLGVSGGLDSVVLLNVMSRIAPHLGAHLTAIYVHHGKLEGVQGDYRNRAYDLVQRLAKDLKVGFYSNYLGNGQFERAPTVELHSEEDFRQFRYKVFSEFLKSSNGGDFNVLTLAHNADDLIETRLLRLIRGTGEQGLEAMQLWDGRLLRPLLGHGRKKLDAYAQTMGLVWQEDPSNAELDALRNWMRHEWLPQLESRCPGGVGILGESLGRIVAATRCQEGSGDDGDIISAEGFSRLRLLELDLAHQRRIIARYMREQGIKGYTQGHIDEIIKRLDKSQKSFTFPLLKYTWMVDAERVRVIPI